MKLRQWIVTTALLLLMAVTVVALLRTREPNQPAESADTGKAPAKRLLVIDGLQKLVTKDTEENARKAGEEWPKHDHHPVSRTGLLGHAGDQRAPDRVWRGGARAIYYPSLRTPRNPQTTI